MHRFYLPPDRCHGDRLTLTGGEAHHASRVRRVTRGELVAVLDGAGREFRCTVQEVDSRELSLRVQETKVHPPPPCQIALLVGIPKAKIIESIIEKATELGAQRIVPLLTERVAVRLDGAAAAEKGNKWQHAAIEACKQCGAAWLPLVEAPVRLTEYLRRKEPFDLALVGALQGAARHPRDYFCAPETMKPLRPRRVAVWIGPEGDFTREELERILASGARPITLGPLVLRVETAAVYCLSFLNYELRSSRD